MRIERLNSTGSFTIIDGDYFSYLTRLSFNYNCEFFVNKTRYSSTTSKHQAHLPYADFNHTLFYQRFGCYPETRCLQWEIDGLKYELETRRNKRKTVHNLNEIKKISDKIEFLSNLIMENL